MQNGLAGCNYDISRMVEAPKSRRPMCFSTLLLNMNVVAIVDGFLDASSNLATSTKFDFTPKKCEKSCAGITLERGNGPIGVNSCSCSGAMAQFL